MMMFTTPMSQEPPRAKNFFGQWLISYQKYILQITQPSKYLYTRMAGFGRREIEYMHALCIYNKYIEFYSVIATLNE